MGYELTDLFGEIDVPFWTSGKNTAPGWVNIQCPFCDDHSNHCGVSLESGYYHCWKCSQVGSLPELLHSITDLSKTEQFQLIKKYKTGEGTKGRKRGEVGELRDILPGCLPFLPELHQEYLKSRRFSPDEIVQMYQVKASHFVGKWRGRLLVPILVNRQIVNFTAMDVTGESDTKYLHCPNDKAIMDMKSILYNMDTVKDRVIICEGVTDVWRMGEGAVATFGTQFTDRQIGLLTGRVKQAWVLYDSDAVKKGERLAYQLAGVIDRVENISLSKGDPADLSPAMVRKIRRWVYG